MGGGGVSGVEVVGVGLFGVVGGSAGIVRRGAGEVIGGGVGRADFRGQ